MVSDKSLQPDRKDVPNAEVHVLEAGHFALDTKANEIAALVRDFMKTQKQIASFSIIRGFAPRLIRV
jgi:hypothetical protein